jgi:hypothetical protein
VHDLLVLVVARRWRSYPIGEIRRLVPVVFLMLPVVVLFALYPGLFTLSRLGR